MRSTSRGSGTSRIQTSTSSLSTGAWRKFGWALATSRLWSTIGENAVSFHPSKRWRTSLQVRARIAHHSFKSASQSCPQSSQAASGWASWVLNLCTNSTPTLTMPTHGPGIRPSSRFVSTGPHNDHSTQIPAGACFPWRRITSELSCSLAASTSQWSRTYQLSQSFPLATTASPSSWAATSTPSRENARPSR